ncbi:putative Xaa-Pro dipeptide hydrolase [Naviculisporaceae sp. PSN 640]
MPPRSKTFKVHSSTLFDPKKKAFLKNISIEIDRASGSIVGLYKRDPESPHRLAPDDIDLTGQVVLPGFVDSHTHIFLHSYKERNGTQQMRDESSVERTVRATNNARVALLSGYTTYRDLGTEALGNADANLRDCINRGITPGPRLFVATDALASSGSYEIRRENRSTLEVPIASDVADGVDGVRAAVRRRVGAGADIIKFYADYRRKVMRFPNVEGADPIQFPPARRNPAIPLYTQEEMNAIVDEASLAEMPVAAHCGETRTAIMAARAGVTSVEHVFEDTYGRLDEMIKELVKSKTIWVPTLATVEAEAPQFMDWCKSAVKKAHDAGVRLAAGGDTGAFAHGLNAREMEMMIEAGIPLEDVLEACTVGGWEACGGDLCGFRFGWFAKGNRADIIALETDPRKDKKALRKVSFVMKDGQVWKRDGVPLESVKYPRWPDEEEEEPEGRSSDEWTDLSTAQPQMSMSVPLPVCRSGLA